MRHVVEVRRDDGGLVELMSLVRSWLDHRNVAPAWFRIDGDMFHLEFATESEAAVFARAFGAQGDRRAGGAGRAALSQRVAS